jgi:long-subunit fatty acid transport protein
MRSVVGARAAAAAPETAPASATVLRAMLATAAALWVALTAGPVAAQSKTGTSIGQFLLIEPSARIAAMGNAGVGLANGIQSVYYNPGAIGPLTGSAVQFTHSLWFADITFDYAAAAVGLSGVGTLFGSVTSLSSGDINVRTVDQPLGTGERYSVSDLAVALGFGKQITHRFAAGLQVNYISETIWHSSLHKLTLSGGTVYRIAENGLTLGASLSNFGTSARFDGRDLAIQYDNDPTRHGDNSALPGEQLTDKFPVPTLFRVGIAYPRHLSETSNLLLALDAFHPSDNTESLSAGAEWSWRDVFALRAGYQNLWQQDSELGLTLGVGLKGDLGGRRIGLDYGWADHQRLSETHRFTVVCAF